MTDDSPLEAIVGARESLERIDLEAVDDETATRLRKAIEKLDETVLHLDSEKLAMLSEATEDSCEDDD